MNIDLAKLFPEASGQKGIVKLVVKYGDIIEHGTDVKKEAGVQQNSCNEHFVTMKNGSKYHFKVTEKDKGSDILTALGFALNLFDSWDVFKNNFPPEQVSSMQRQKDEAITFINYCSLKYC